MVIEVRRKWILNENPRVSKVIVEFPCFKDPEIVFNNKLIDAIHVTLMY